VADTGPNAMRVLSHGFLAVVLVLLALMRASAEMCVHPRVDAPRAWNTKPLRDTTLVEINAGFVRVGGDVVGYTAEVGAEGPRALAQLVEALRARRHPCGPSSDDCRALALSVDRHVTSGVVKAVMTAASRAGYEHYDFLTERWIAMASSPEDPP
jgi:biopolymer transport protein ExbD